MYREQKGENTNCFWGVKVERGKKTESSGSSVDIPPKLNPNF